MHPVVPIMLKYCLLEELQGDIFVTLLQHVGDDGYFGPDVDALRESCIFDADRLCDDLFQLMAAKLVTELLPGLDLVC